ncbi:hypothetical protein P3X46_030543 [Hevea brasiliensis]|uniref:Pectate lyase superfamily protein domain-containing protein n=1 Tax=Hevea brasiliensis TaxID=3981 RepID=A0ABQ9KKJ4_HEVBR|nr:hypothetical protein P3X46_030543 [Hevea brasiliensis]
MSTKYHILQLLSILILVGYVSLPIAESRNVQILKKKTTINYPAISCRKHTAALTEFGGVGDGKTLNTEAFQSAIANLSQYGSDGGAQLIVPPGKWLTESFNLTRHFTLFLQEGTVLLASQQNFPDGRFASVILGMNLADVVITGNNGTIDGQGAPWWDKIKKGLLKATRPFLIELMYTNQLQISNITLTNSPSWRVHPIYCSNVVIQGVTILAPVEVPNIDGINPGLTCISPHSATIALGSEMSGGIQDVRAEDITAISTESAVRIKTASGRGGYIKDIFVRRMTLKTMKYVFWITGAYKSHPDNGYDPNALAVINNINYIDLVADNVSVTGSLDGYAKDPFTGICIYNATITLSETAKNLQWNCADIQGVSNKVTPKPCDLLPQNATDCTFPDNKLPIETVHLKTCSVKKIFL